MGRIRLFQIIILIGILSCSDQKKEIALSLITEIRKEYAPDRRTAIFEIELENKKTLVIRGETSLPDAKDILLDRLNFMGIDVQTDIIVLPGEEVGEEKFALINVSVANLRSHPAHSAELVTQALLGTPVNVLKKNNGWFLIQTPDSYIAWTNDGSIVPLDLEQLERWKKDRKIIYVNTYGFAKSTEGSQRVSDLVAGNVLPIDNENEESWIVKYPDDRRAIIPKSEAIDLDIWNENLVTSQNSISEAAHELMGVPYLWGGTSTKGLDCSGFTKTVYFHHGIILPRDASQQVHTGDLVDTERNFSNLEVGDLLFFGTINEDQSEQVVHVGLWLGDNKFIHASGDVHISSMDSLDEDFDEYNYNRYLRTKRIIGSESIGLNMIADIYR